MDNMLAKSVISNANGIIDAIDRYIAKADEDLEGTLQDEGFAEASETVDAVNSLEEQIADALDAQTEGVIEALEEAESNNASPDELNAMIKELLESDSIDSDVEQTTLDMYEVEVPQLANVYIQESDGELVVETLRQRTSSWMQEWSATLGELTKISTHERITSLITQSISDGESIADLTKRIKDGGWRNEHYQAKRYALTETLRAHSVAREESIQQSPSCSKKEWRHTGAHKNEPRPNHVAIGS